MLIVNEWRERYEVSIKGREPLNGEDLRVGPLSFIRLKVFGHKQGVGFRRMKQVAGDRAMEVFGVFCKFLEISGNQPREKRGRLLNENNKPATIEDLAFILDVKPEIVDNAIKVLLKTRWLISDSESPTPPNSTQLNTTQASRKNTGLPGVSGKIRKESVIFDENSEAYRLSTLLFSLIRERKPDYKQPNLKEWAKHVDLMLRIDKRTPEGVEKVIRWCQSDTGDGGDWKGWQNNILSTAKLREKFDMLELRMKEAKGGQNPKDPSSTPLEVAPTGLTPKEQFQQSIRKQAEDTF